MAEQCTDPACEDWRIPHPPHDECRWSLAHRNRHPGQACSCICRLSLGHVGRHQCEVELAMAAEGYPGGMAT